MYTCAIVILINCTSLPWNDGDGKVLESAMSECPQRYSRSPCVNKFIKYNKLSHGVLCGRPLPEKDNDHTSELPEETSATRRTEKFSTSAGEDVGLRERFCDKFTSSKRQVRYSDDDSALAKEVLNHNAE